MKIAALATETANEHTRDLDTMSVAELLAVMNAEDRTVPHAVEGAQDDLTLAATVSVACNVGSQISAHADVAIEVDTGPEVLTGSTRLKAGTALSTASMIRTGKAFHDLMVDVRPTNAKLVDRARRIVSAATGADPASAAIAIDRLQRSRGGVRAAVEAQRVAARH